MKERKKKNEISRAKNYGKPGFEKFNDFANRKHFCLTNMI